MDKTLRTINRFLVVNRYINRPAASLLVQGLKKTRATPNQVTVVSLAAGVAGAGCFLLGRPWGFLCGGILVQISSIIDCADGMLARELGISSTYGAYLDVFLDRINEFFIITAYMIGWYFYSGNTPALVLGLTAAALYFLQITLYYITKRFQGNNAEGETNEARALLLFLVFIFGIFGRLEPGIYLLLTVALAVNIVSVIRFARIPLRSSK